MVDQAVVPDRIPKTIEFERDQLAALDALRRRARRSSFSDTVRFAVHHGLVAIQQLEEAGRLVA